jgi:secreted trypsin-like serine protease
MPKTLQNWISFTLEALRSHQVLSALIKVKNFATIKFSGLPISKLIIGGELSAPKQFPWQAQLRIENSWLCGGSLISETFILTAAHCLIGYVVSNAEMVIPF